MQNSGRTAKQSIDEATALLYDLYESTLVACGNQATRPLAIKPGLDAKEAEYFLLGMEHGIFSIDDHGYAQSAVLPPSPKRETRNRILQLIWQRKGRRFLFREGVCQLATVSELVLEQHWPIEQIQMEPALPDLRYAVDILLKDAGRSPVAACEVKRDNREFDLLLSSFRDCCARGFHGKNECAFRENHPKYELCAEVKPQYFMLASPGRQLSLRISYEHGGVRIAEEIEGLVSALVAASDVRAIGCGKLQ